MEFLTAADDGMLSHLLLPQQQPAPLCVLIAASILIKPVPLWYTQAGQRVPHIQEAAEQKAAERNMMSSLLADIIQSSCMKVQMRA